MKTNFKIFIKASEKSFRLERTPQVEKSLFYEAPHFVCLTNDPAAIRFDGADEHGNLRLEYGYSSGAYAKIRWFESEKRLEVELDELGLQSLFFHDDGCTVCLSNQIDLLEHTIAKPRLSLKSIQFFLVAGFLPPGWNFIENICRVDQSSIWFLSEERSLHKTADWMQYTRQTEPDVGETIQLLRDAVRNIEEEAAPTEIRLSGGADTRIISSMISKPLIARVVQSPWMKDGQDLDVNLSQAWAKEIGLNFEIIRVAEEQFHFFTGDSDRPVLAGIAGGEFLGGQFIRVIPSHPEEWMERAKKILSPSSFEVLKADPWIQRVMKSDIEWRVECARIFLQSTRATIYQSFRGSWATPYSIMARVVSPFTSPIFLKRFLSLSLETLGDYEFYEKIFEEMGPHLLKIPLCSQITLRRPDWQAAPEWGQEPKSSRPPLSLMKPIEEVVEDSVSLCNRKQLDLNRIELSAFADDAKTRLALRSVHMWLATRDSN